MHLIDWLIVIVPLMIVAFIGYRTRRYVKGVSDFLVAGRVAGRYVVAVANGEAMIGLVSIVALFEVYYKSGFALGFWRMAGTPLTLLIVLTGFAIYRFRETRAMTLAQFFEIRYSKRFRIFAGSLQAISGVINYALFPAVGARFLVYFCGLPGHVEILGMAWPTYGLVMAIFLSVAVFIVTLGGQVTVMTTDCVQGILSYPMYLIVIIAIMTRFSWSGEMAPALLDRPEGMSMLNPFDIQNLRHFNVFYIIVSVVCNHIYNILSWSGTQGYNAAAINPHEQKMGKILGTWRDAFTALIIVLLAIAAYTYMNSPGFARRAELTNRDLSWKALNDVAGDCGSEQAERTDKNIRAREAALNSSQEQVYNTIRGQMRAPMALRSILPVGITGVFCAIMVFLLISTDTTYMHSWGSIIVQDVILPFRRRPFTPRQQLLLLRLAIVGVAVFAFIFSLFYGQVTYIMMFMALTGSIWLGGAGSVILGGLYWKKGTSAGAWAALLTGATLALLGFVGINYWVSWIYPALARSPAALEWVSRIVAGCSRPFEPFIVWRVTAEEFPINGQEIYFITMLMSVAMYLVVSFLTCRKPFNMERMLHRGKYSRREDQAQAQIKDVQQPRRHLNKLLRYLLGIDENFSKGDKILSWSVFVYSMGWGFGAWLVILLWNILIGRWPKEWWSTWFYIQYFVVAFIIGLVSTVWFSIGGIWDLRRMFKRLSTHRVDVLDDGRVIGHVNVDDLQTVEQVDHVHIEEADRAEQVPRPQGSEQ